MERGCCPRLLLASRFLPKCKPGISLKTSGAPSQETIHVSKLSAQRLGAALPSVECLLMSVRVTGIGRTIRRLGAAELDAVRRHALGTIAIDIPVLLTFLLLLTSRISLPRHAHDLTRLNRSRLRYHKAPFLDHIEVRAPLLPEYLGYPRSEPGSTRRGRASIMSAAISCAPETASSGEFRTCAALHEPERFPCAPSPGPSTKLAETDRRLAASVLPHVR
jgi:hypothetical protein